MRFTAWWPQLSPQVWILVAGRFLSQIGSGIVLFYVPIYFVNQVRLSAAQVGLGLSSAAMAGAVGFFLAGAITDSPRWGRRRTLMLSCVISVFADGVFWFAQSLPLLILASVLMGLGDSLYWPASGAAITDESPDHQREEAFAVSGLADALGSGLGIVLGGLLIATANGYRLLFVVDGVTFLMFLGVLTVMVKDTYVQPSQNATHSGFKAWRLALLDPVFLGFAIANILFTTYINLMESTLPLYLTNFVQPSSWLSLTPENIGILFSVYVLIVAVLQVPAVRVLQRYQRASVLILSMMSWGAGFLLIWLVGWGAGWQLILIVLAIAILAIANVIYNPFAVALVTELAPKPSLGIYLSLNAQCWTVGYLIGPLVGGWALTQGETTAHTLWAVVSFSTLIGALVLKQLAKFHKKDLASKQNIEPLDYHSYSD
ncbi:MFS transporter [Oscillatoria sp. CS-180]|uniref:MFS transporter n=1 Tax=Oscillatoria sp. CS-180 TaxID=3021720 RepID=UPI002330EC80|nr:MFS transporter [Oscillatoria sp. CS-180]MDB9525120.1 MFS transporter [Oscillatoria sp. CS-180]